MSTSPLKEPQSLRQNLVDEAAKFLIHPKVFSHAEEQKLAFLKKKGLSEQEIASAFSKAKAIVPTGKGGNVTPSLPALYRETVVPVYPTHGPPSLWVKIRDICNLILILTGASYGLYYLYQRYIGPWLTGRHHKTVEESMVELQQSMVSVLKEVHSTLASLEQNLSAQNAHIQALNNREENHQGSVSPKQLEQLKTEVSSLKGLLINKRTFPSTPNMAPSIPSWQRNKSTEKPLEAAAEPAVTMSNQVEVTEEGDSAWPSPNTEEAVIHEINDAVGDTTQTMVVGNGEMNEDVLKEKEDHEYLEEYP